jgi:hypothetical protein
MTDTAVDVMTPRSFLGTAPAMPKLPRGSDSIATNTSAMDGTHTFEKDAFSALIAATCGKRPLSIPTESTVEALDGCKQVFSKKPFRTIRPGPQRGLATSSPTRHTNAFNNIGAASVGRAEVAAQSEIANASKIAADVCRDDGATDAGGGVGTGRDSGGSAWRFAGWDDVVDARNVVPSSANSFKKCLPFSNATKTKPKMSTCGMLKPFGISKKERRNSSAPTTGAIATRYGLGFNAEMHSTTTSDIKFVKQSTTS